MPESRLIPFSVMSPAVVSLHGFPLAKSFLRIRGRYCKMKESQKPCLKERICAKETEKPYYEVSSNVLSQIKSGSRRKGTNAFSFLLKKTINFILERLAYNCPINSWRVRFHRCRGVRVGKNVLIAMQVTLDHSYPSYIVIEDDVSLAGNNYLLAHSNPYPHFKNVLNSYVAEVRIKRGAWLGIGAMVLPGVTIGRYSIISAGSVVAKDVPDRVIAGGVPARVLKEIDLGNIGEL